jgi:hypothetical protein
MTRWSDTFFTMLSLDYYRLMSHAYLYRYINKKDEGKHPKKTKGNIQKQEREQA